MFRWCAFCQHLIGEAPPLDDFQVTHGICNACSVGAATHAPTPGVLRARDLFSTLEQAGRSGDYQACEQAIDEALASGLYPSEIMIGVLHPSLSRIGELWASGEITVADEHRFTTFSLHLLDRLLIRHSAEVAPGVLLAPFEDNTHDIGMQIIQHIARERGIFCERLPVGTTRDELLDAIANRRPSIVGLSVSLVETVPAAMDFVRELSGKLPIGTAVILGGQGFRRDDLPDIPHDLTVARTIDDFVSHLETLRHPR